MTAPRPFSLDPVEEVHLADAPLARVLAQVQFSRTPSLVSDAGESALAELLGRYPVRRRGISQVFSVQIGAGGFSQAPAQPGPQVLTFAEAKDRWKVTVTDTSISLETTDYDSRDDFCDRVFEVLRAVVAVELPPVLDRVGLRYIDRLAGDALGRVPAYMAPALVGMLGAVDPDLTILQSVTQSQIQVDANELITVNSGLLPPNAVVDATVPPLAEPSWLLDIDVATIRVDDPFDPEQITASIRTFAEHAYYFFRFATTDAFLHAHGAEAK